MAEISEKERLIGRHVRECFGGTTSVHRYGDDSGEHSIFIVSGADCPVSGVSSYGTVGLSLYPMPLNDGSVNVEVVGACASSVPEFGNAISSCAFDRKKNGTVIVYGSYIENVLDQYSISTSLRHLVFLSPFLWDCFSGGRVFDGLEVHWLMAVPISDSELDYLRSHGTDALENEFEAAQIDVFDINRPAVL